MYVLICYYDYIKKKCKDVYGYKKKDSSELFHFGTLGNLL